MPNLISANTNEIIKKLKQTYGDTYPDPEFWDYVFNAVLSNPPLGQPEYQTGYINNLFKQWSDKVNSGQIKLNTPTPSSVTPAAVAPIVGNTKAGTSEIITNYQDTGYDVTVQYDDNGKPIITDVLPKSKTDKITPYEQAQLDLAQQKWKAEDFANRQQQVLDTERNRQTQAANQWSRYNSQFGINEDAIRQQVRSENASTYENWRRQLLGSLTDSRDWITKWQVQNQPNPYVPEVSTIESLQATVKSAQTEEKNAKASYDDWNKRFTDNTELVDPQIITAAGNRYNTAVEQRNRWQGELESYTNTPEYQTASQPRETGIGGNKVISGTPEMAQKPSGIPVPSWLPKFVPQLAGKSEFAPTEKYQVPTPSGQMWQATPPSIKQGLAGYMDWTGQDYQDTLNSMSMMLPNTPNIAGRWQPRRY